MLAASWSPGWSAIVGLAIILAVFCFLAVLWSKREWNTRKIRVGMFLEREYKNEENEEDTEILPPERRP